MCLLGDGFTIRNWGFTLRHNLDSGFTFASFMPGACNRFAYAAALLVAQNPGGNHNPLWISSKVGRGKTHLMTAIGHEVSSRDNSKRVLFVHANTFIDEMIFQQTRDELFCVTMDCGEQIKTVYENLDRPSQAESDAREWNLFKPVLALGMAISNPDTRNP